MAKTTPPKPTEQDEQDAPWKQILRQYFQEAMEFFFPEIAKEFSEAIGLLRSLG